MLHRENLIREALHIDRDNQPLSNMPPKPTLCYTSVPSSIGGRGGNQGRGSGRGASIDDDVRDSMPHCAEEVEPLALKTEG